MKKALPTIRKKKGFTLLEAILSVALFALIIMAFTEAIYMGEQSTALSGARMRAVLVAEEALEAVRNLRDGDFTNLPDGNYGLNIANNIWTLSATDEATEIFTRRVTISSIDANTKSVVSSVNWQQNPQRTGNVTLETRLTNWRRLVDQAVYLVLLGEPYWSGQGAAKPNLVGLQLQNIAPFPIIIDKITVSWTKPIRNLKSIILGGRYVYEGNASSGTTIDIADFTLESGITYDMDEVKFDGLMKDSDFIVTFIMKDGSGSLTTTFYPLTN